MGAVITNGCTGEQRVEATFASGQIPCAVLQPGQAVTQWVWPGAPFNQFLGLVRC
ncbi:hypothetical protein ACWEF9_37740 [Streptomyces sp. NPDC004980]